MWALALIATPLLLFFFCSKVNAKQSQQPPSGIEVAKNSRSAIKPIQVKGGNPDPGTKESEAGVVATDSRDLKEEEKKVEDKTDNDKEKGSKKVDPEDPRSKWAHRIIQLKCKAISQEFTDKIKKYSAPGQTYEAHNENPIKNRYTDVLCMDATRVVLKGRGKDDYIHASWVTTPYNTSRYICTQGPLPETVEDFWAMVFQEKTKLCVMLCNICEGGAEKCTQYWPEKKGTTQTYGAYKVTNVEMKPDPIEGVHWSLLDINFKGDIFQVHHIFCTWWPDQLAPADPNPMISLYKWVRKQNEKSAPILVHCSAGVGRTATFVGIEYANIRIKENANTNLMDVIKEMRGQRFQAIQSHLQYLYLHICLLEFFVQDGCLARDERLIEFMEEYKHHAERKLAKRRNEEKDDSIQRR